MSYKVGQRVSLTGEIIRVANNEDYFDVRFDGDGGYSNQISLAAMTHATIVKEPEPKCSKEFAKELQARLQGLPVGEMRAWIDSHTE